MLSQMLEGYTVEINNDNQGVILQIDNYGVNWRS